MTRTKVSANILRSIGYDPDTEQLELEFTSGDIFDYQKVKPYSYMGLMNSNTKDDYFNKYIRDNYEVEKIKEISRAALYVA
jgi:KTSC domain